MERIFPQTLQSTIKEQKVSLQTGGSTAICLPTTTTVIVHCLVEKGGQLTIRGSESPLSWTRGTVLEQIASAVWCWQCSVPLLPTEYKILLNDTLWEEGDNRKLFCGEQQDITPRFIK